VCVHIKYEAENCRVRNHWGQSTYDQLLEGLHKKKEGGATGREYVSDYYYETMK